MITKQKPYDWAKYDRTGNNSIDLVMQCVGYNRAAKKPLKAIILKPTSFDLFKAGMRVLMEKQGVAMEDLTEFTFDGTPVKRGTNLQFDTLYCEYYVVRLPKINN